MDTDYCLKNVTQLHNPNGKHWGSFKIFRLVLKLSVSIIHYCLFLCVIDVELVVMTHALVTSAPLVLNIEAYKKLLGILNPKRAVNEKGTPNKKDISKELIIYPERTEEFNE